MRELSQCETQVRDRCFVALVVVLALARWPTTTTTRANTKRSLDRYQMGATLFHFVSSRLNVELVKASQTHKACAES